MPEPVENLTIAEQRKILAKRAPVQRVAWDAGMVFRLLRVESAKREDVLAAVRTAVDDGRLPPAAVKAVIKAGFPELSN